jgi:putative endonuclease
MKPAMKAAKKVAAFTFGLSSETRAAWLLRCKGYRILARRAKHPVGEIDLIAKRGKLLAFVEVKARRSVGEAIHSITHNQRRRIERAAEAFVAHRPTLASCDWRFDVVILEGRWGWPRHVADAWRPGESVPD